MKADTEHAPTAGRRILGVNMQVTDIRQAILERDRRIAERKDTRGAFFNAHLANLASEDVAFSETLASFLDFNDGLGIELESRTLYKLPLPSNHNGTDFVPKFLDETRHNLRLALVGGRPEVINRVIENLPRRWPRHRVVASHHGFFSPTEEAAIAQSIKAAAPDVVLVAMGNPKQEKWIGRNVPAICPVGLGIGTFFDFFAGIVPRAPRLIRRLRMEWLYRLAIEPRRLWRRYTINNIFFMTRVLRQYRERVN